MTLLEMSVQYKTDADTFARRIKDLQQQAQKTDDPEVRWQLQQRIAALTPLLRQSRALAQITEHYYDRGYTKHAQYHL